MASTTIRAEVDGLADVMKKLDGLKRRIRGRVLRQAVRAGSGIILSAAKKRVKAVSHSLTQKALGQLAVEDLELLDRVGLLRNSLGVKMVVRRDGSALAVIGPRRGFKSQIGVRKRSGKFSQKGDPIYEDPANIGHLVEFGHGGPHPAPPHPFMRPAWDESLSAVRSKMAAVMAAGITSVD